MTMTIIHGVEFFMATYLYIGILALQSRNVNSGQYVAAAMTSAIIGGLQVFSVRTMALANAWDAFILTSTAGPAGVVSAMYLHRKLLNRKKG
jgi:hypothetical protein